MKNPSHTVWILAICILTLFGCSDRTNLADAKRPNFVIIFTDDQGYADLSCYGGTHVNTPRIDRMAAEGVRLTSFYVAAPDPTSSASCIVRLYG